MNVLFLLKNLIVVLTLIRCCSDFSFCQLVSLSLIVFIETVLNLMLMRQTRIIPWLWSLHKGTSSKQMRYHIECKDWYILQHDHNLHYTTILTIYTIWMSQPAYSLLYMYILENPQTIPRNIQLKLPVNLPLHRHIGRVLLITVILVLFSCRVVASPSGKS